MLTVICIAPPTIHVKTNKNDDNDDDNDNNENIDKISVIIG